ncbi:type II toxin-antitoxin system RelE/ParE family toxin [Maledivibacter halophilus]|uniref:Addiction module toxin, RelE/StbE family n=1 Tax=Maledivibacter halophilus TaxID=36842 RepID=A0A1T5K0W7_9FIRM|nr:type II toxin-antitoxin system mRNA interferase toxin, RelE/StbE family [Maledivibacter halophilus]SKC57291.1 addiction module toxin, RelE/StbE family [Maledivibacter halophilus]
MVENSYKIKITPKADNDLDEIYGYITNELLNGDAAENLMNKIETSIMRLKQFPFSCSHVEDDVLKDKGYRKLIIKNYIVFYIVDKIEKQVVVMRVLYGPQKYQDII